MKKLTCIFFISGILATFFSFLSLLFLNINFIKKEKFIKILENIIKILIKRKDFEMLNYIFNNLLLLKRILRVSLILQNGLRIIKEKTVKKNYKIYSIKRDINETGAYLGKIEINIIS